MKKKIRYGVVFIAAIFVLGVMFFVANKKVNAGAPVTCSMCRVLDSNPNSHCHECWPVSMGSDEDDDSNDIGGEMSDADGNSMW